MNSGAVPSDLKSGPRAWLEMCGFNRMGSGAMCWHVFSNSKRQDDTRWYKMYLTIFDLLIPFVFSFHDLFSHIVSDWIQPGYLNILGSAEDLIAAGAEDWITPSWWDAKENVSCRPKQNNSFIWFQIWFLIMVSWGFCMIVVGFNELMPTTKVDHAMVVLEWFCWNMFWTCFCMVAFMMWHDNFQKTWLWWPHVAHVLCFQPVLVQVVDLGAEWLARAERKASNLRSSAVTRFDVGPSGWDEAKSKT